MRYGSTLAILVFAVALIAAVVAGIRWTLVIRRLAADLESKGLHRRADLLWQLFRTTLIGGGGTVAFTVILWAAILHDLEGC